MLLKYTDSAFGVFWVLCLLHLAMDFPGQPSVMAIGKNPHAKDQPVHWFYWLTSHAAMHALAVWLVLDVVWFSMAEFAAHWIIDYTKCELTYRLDEGIWPFRVRYPGLRPSSPWSAEAREDTKPLLFFADQAAHILCKLLWVVIAFTFYTITFT